MVRRSAFVSGIGALFLASTGLAQPPGGFPGPFEPPKPGQVLPGFMQDQLKLSAEQKKQLDELQKEVDAKLSKILTPEQKKSLEDMRTFRGPGGFGPPGGPGPGGPGGFGPPGGFGGSFGALRNGDVQKRLAASDEEWKVILPKIEKVAAARQVLTPEVRGGGFGFGGPGGSNIVSQAQADLRAVLDDPKHTRAEVEEKVAAVRKARLKARAELEAAQKDLLQMVTSMQEAVLISLGCLE